MSSALNTVEKRNYYFQNCIFLSEPILKLPSNPASSGFQISIMHLCCLQYERKQALLQRIGRLHLGEQSLKPQSMLMIPPGFAIMPKYFPQINETLKSPFVLSVQGYRLLLLVCWVLKMMSKSTPSIKRIALEVTVPWADWAVMIYQQIAYGSPLVLESHSKAIDIAREPVRQPKFTPFIANFSKAFGSHFSVHLGTRSFV